MSYNTKILLEREGGREGGREGEREREGGREGGRGSGRGGREEREWEWRGGGGLGPIFCQNSIINRTYIGQQHYSNAVHTATPPQSPYTSQQVSDKSRHQSTTMTTHAHLPAITIS